ncbi:hypothetical protein KW800_01845 [Candidatus Parcubacteria bacterium]|nr:hypothetical protein [Candidatus Parcubacteria bacterium]
MAVEIQNNPSGGDNGGSAMTALVAILVIVVIGLAIWFGFRHTGSSGGTNVNVSLPTTSGGTGGVTGGAGY